MMDPSKLTCNIIVQCFWFKSIASGQQCLGWGMTYNSNTCKEVCASVNIETRDYNYAKFGVFYAKNLSMTPNKSYRESR